MLGNYQEETVQHSEHGEGLSKLIWSLTSVSDTVKQQCLDEHSIRVLPIPEF
jgi:hypothetical protein